MKRPSALGRSVAAAVLACAWGGSMVHGGDEAARYYSQGRERFLLFHAQGFSQAEKLFLKAIESDPGFAKANAALAETYYYWASRNIRVGREYKSFMVSSNRYAQEAYRLDPGLAESNRVKGLLAGAFSKGDKDKVKIAGEIIQEAIDIAPDDFLSYYALWIFHDLDPDHPSIRRALELNARFIAGLRDLGASLAAAERYDEALSYFERALKVNPGDSTTHLYLGQLYAAQGSLDKALRSLRRAVRLNPALGDARQSLALVLVKMGKNKEALAAFKEAVAAQPRSAAARANLGQFYLDQGRLDLALLELEMALGYDPDIHMLGLGVAYSMSGMPDKAIKEFQRVNKLRPSAGGCYYLGRSLEAKKEDDRAVASYRQALGLDPEFRAAYKPLAGALGRAGRYAEMAGVLKAYLEREPKDLAGQELYADALIAAGDMPAAAEQLRRFIASAEWVIGREAQVALARQKLAKVVERIEARK